VQGLVGSAASHNGNLLAASNLLCQYDAECLEKSGFESFVTVTCLAHESGKFHFVAKRIQKRVSREIGIGKESVADTVTQDSKR
jgi:hypothetical protein